VNTELAEDVLEVLAHGSRAYEELFRDLGLVEPLNEERENVEFPLGQLVRLPSVEAEAGRSLLTRASSSSGSNGFTT
jgi:hypothetical protein